MKDSLQRSLPSFRTPRFHRPDLRRSRLKGCSGVRDKTRSASGDFWTSRGIFSSGELKLRKATKQDQRRGHGPPLASDREDPIPSLNDSLPHSPPLPTSTDREGTKWRQATRDGDNPMCFIRLDQEGEEREREKRERGPLKAREIKQWMQPDPPPWGNVKGAAYARERSPCQTFLE